jgi:hypothetical protein
MRRIKETRLTMPHEVIQAAEHYLPLILAVANQKEAAAAVPTRKPLELVWTSAVAVPAPDENQIRIFTYRSYVEECQSVFFLFALAHYQMADAVLHGATADGKEDLVTKAEDRDLSKEAVPWLRKASGIFQWMTSVLLPSLPSGDQARSPDTWPSVCVCLAALSLANAQELALYQALFKMKSSHGTIVKLCLGACDKFKEALHAISKEPPAALVHVRPELQQYLALKAQYYEAVAYKFQAMLCRDEKKHGHAAHYAERAVHTITRMRFPEVKNAGLQSFRDRVRAATAEMQQLQEEVVKDNNSVYFQPVPSAAEAHPLPAGNFIMQPVDYNGPPPVDSSFFAVDPSKKGQCIVS